MMTLVIVLMRMIANNGNNDEKSVDEKGRILDEFPLQLLFDVFFFVVMIMRILVMMMIVVIPIALATGRNPTIWRDKISNFLFLTGLFDSLRNLTHFDQKQNAWG